MRQLIWLYGVKIPSLALCIGVALGLVLIAAPEYRADVVTLWRGAHHGR